MRRGRSFARIDQAFDIFCEDVDLHIDGVAGNHGVNVCVLVREGNYGDVGDAVMRLPAGNGEADSVERDRTFFSDVAAKILRNADGKPPVFTFRREARDAADAVDVTLDEMAAKARGGCERTFEIYRLADFFLAEGSAAKSFAGEIGGECV